jgi:RNA polymerase sigma-70 factor (ECF subfamily)
VGYREEHGQGALSDEGIVEMYWQRDEEAIKATDEKYGKYLTSIAYNVLHDSIDCDQCLSDTYLSAWNAIPPERPRSLGAFLTVIIRRKAINLYHRRRRKGSVPSEMTVSLSELEFLLADEGDLAEELEYKRLGEVIGSFVRSLPSRRRYIFMSRYYLAEPIDKIAQDLMVSRSTVNKELAFIRAILRARLESEGYTI